MAETELWLIDLDETAATLETIEQTTPRLSEACARRFAAMADAAARRERRLAHIALRILLERRTGPAIRRTPFAVSASGKPSLQAGDVEFSLAHTAALALIALGNGPLGVDIERMRPVAMADARRAPIEQAAVALAGGAPLAGPDRDARFLSAWVRLEAVGKAEGTGVGPLLERLRPGRASSSPDPASAVAHDIPVAEGLFAAVALAPGLTPPALRRLPGAVSALSALLGPADGTR